MDSSVDYMETSRRADRPGWGCVADAIPILLAGDVPLRATVDTEGGLLIPCGVVSALLSAQRHAVVLCRCADAGV